MYKCKELTDSNIKQMMGSISYNDVLTYDLRTGRLSAHHYNGQLLPSEREIKEWINLAEYNFNRMNRHGWYISTIIAMYIIINI